MRIPTPLPAAGPALLFISSHISTKPSDLHSNLPESEGWSSLIGIVTAISGNILISFALNTQRYAHIKLNEQYAERQRLLKQAQRRAAARQRGYGTQENSLFKDRIMRKGAAPDEWRGWTNGRHSEEEDAGESEPMLSSSVYSDPDRLDNQAKEPFPEEEAQKSYLRSPYWWAGIIMMTVGEAGNFLAYGFAPASIVSPLGVVALISNCIIAPFFLKEPFRKRDLLGVFIAVAGAVTVVLSASDSNPKLGPHEIWKLIGRWEFETYLGITVGLIIALMWASSRYGGKSIFIDIGLVGLFGGYTALSTKGVASMLSYTLFRALTFPVTYLLVAVLVFTAVMQIKYVNRALKNFDATQVIPTQFVLFTLSVIIGSAILYRDFEKESAEDAGKFIGGCALTFFGVYLITSARKQGVDDEEDFESDEEAIVLVPGQTYHDTEHIESIVSRRQSSTLASTLEEDEPQPNRRASISNHPYGSASLPDLGNELTPTISRHYSQPVSLAARSLLPESHWTAPEQQSTEARRSMQKLLRPLSKLFPDQDSQSLPSTLKSTQSTPVLPQEARLQRPQTPNRNHSNQDRPVTPTTPYTTDGSHLLSRHSIADLMPGPLTSTLSSPLSAIVADSLRRGVDVSTLKPKRKRRLPGMPRRSSLRNRGNSENDARVGLLADGSLSSIPTESSGQSKDLEGSRSRSLSNTFGDFFRNIKKSRRGSQTDSAGPSEPPTQPTTPQEHQGYFTEQP